MSYLDIMLRLDRQYERLDDLARYTAQIVALLDNAAEGFPQHIQQLEQMHREAEAAKGVARDVIEEE